MISWLWIVLPLLASSCDFFDREPPGSFAEFQNTQKEVTEALIAQGATISQKPYPILGSTNVVDLSGAQITDMDAMVGLLLKLHKVSELNLSGSTITDEQARRIAEIKTFFILNLSNTSIGDQALNNFANHTVLTKFNVSGTKVTEAGIDAMQKRRKAEMPRYPPIEVINE